MGAFIVVASLDSSEGGRALGLTLVISNCLYGGLYFGRWYEARVVRSGIVELAGLEPADQRTPTGHDDALIAEFAEAVLRRFDREATESHRLRVMVSFLLIPTLFWVLVWIATLYW